MWPDRRIQQLFGIELPIVQAPMAGATQAEMVIGAARAGALGSLPCAMLSLEQVREQCRLIREATDRPLNLNFFCHRPPLPDPELLDRVRASGARIVSSATTVAEARWLERHGCDAIIAQGAEAGGHRGMFLSDDIATQPGLFALLPQIVDAVRLPVIAAGGIGDARGIAAAFALGAAAVQVGTAYLFCAEARLSPLHRQALHQAGDDRTALTNVFTGRPARGIVNRLMREAGPMSALAPPFPLAGGALAPLRAKAEAAGAADFMPLWSGQARFPHALSSEELTQTLAEQAQALMAGPGRVDETART